MFLVSARTDKSGPLSKSMSQFWVERRAAGLEIEINRLELEDIFGNVQLHLDDVRVPESHVVGEINKQWQVAISRLGGKLIIYACVVGSCQRMYERIRDYAKERIQGGKPIIQHANIGAIVAEAAVNLEATRALFYRAAWEYDQSEKRSGSGVINPFWADACNAFYKKMAVRLCEIGADVFAGVGASRDMPLGKFIRNIYAVYHGGSTPNMNLFKCVPYL